MLRSLLFAALLLPALGTDAEARRGGSVRIDTEQRLYPVSATRIPDAAGLGAMATLCHMVEIRSLWGILGIWAAPEAYVLSGSGCAGDAYWTLPAPVDEMAATGLLVDTVPEAPGYLAMPLGAWRDGFGAWGLVGSVVAIGAAAAGLRGRRRRLRLEILGLEDGPAFRLIDMMCHAAIVDGDIDDAEVAHIRDVARDVAQRNYTDAHIREAILRADKLSRTQHFAKVGRTLTEAQRRLVLQCVLSVVAADGRMTVAEQRFVGALMGGFALEKAALDDAMARAVTPRSGAAPA